MTEVEKVYDAIVDDWLKHGKITKAMARAAIKAMRKARS